MVNGYTPPPGATGGVTPGPYRLTLFKKWCGREDSNFHGLSPTTTSTLRVYQFRHDRTDFVHRMNPVAGKAAAPSKAFRGMQPPFLRSFF